jgi:hypothetical protein
LKYAQTQPGGRLIIRDVVGPENKEQEVYLRLEHRDGSNEAIQADFHEPRALSEHLQHLSTLARFKRFACDFLPDRRREAGSGNAAFPYREVVVQGDRYVVLTLRHAVEFMTKMDYVDNWASEMHEEFAFWSFSEWKAALVKAGFRVMENPNAAQEGSRIYTSHWIAENRWQGKVALYRKVHGRLQALPYPPTNIVLVGQK